MLYRKETSGCPAEAKHYLNFCYWVETYSRSMADANTQCGDKGGTLAKIPDAATLQFLEDNLSSDFG